MDYHIIKISRNKKQYLDLLLLGDEQETMIDRYLERGDLFVLEDNGINSDLSILSYDFHPRVAIIYSPKVEPTNLKFSVTKRILSIAKVIRFPSLREIPLL